MREITYVQALNEALHQKIADDESVLLIGQGVDSPWYAGQSTVGLADRFGKQRIIDTPISEDCITGAAAGAALAGMKPIVFHARMDFALYAMDQMVNHAANWHYMFGGQASMPLTLWLIINRGGEQAAQHSQALQAMFAHVPGLKVVMPSNAYDAKGLLLASIEDPNPVVFIDDRWLYQDISEVPEEMYSIPVGKGQILREGSDVTIAAVSYMVGEAIKAAEILQTRNISAEVINLRSVKPLDEDMILASVKKTGRLVVVDSGWRSFGISAEISAMVAEKAFTLLKSPVKRVAIPDIPAPASCVLETAYYPDEKSIVTAVEEILKR